MRRCLILCTIAWSIVVSACSQPPSPQSAAPPTAQTPPAEPHGWLGTETLKTRAGDFAFKNGYPAGDTTQRLRDLQTVNRATEVYLTQLMPVSEIALREGLRAFGATKPTQVVIWERLMDAKTVLLTANTETVYAISHLALRTDGPTVVEAPSRMLGFLQDGLQRYLADIGPLGPDKGKGGKFLVLAPRDSPANVPDGYFVVRSPTYSVTFAVRGFQVDGKTDQAVSLMKQIKVYPLDKASSPPPMEFMNGSGKDIDTLFPDNVRFFELLAMLVEEEPLDTFAPFERSMMQTIGIEKGKGVRARRKDKRASVGSGAPRRSDGAGQHLRLARARCLLLSRSQVAGPRLAA